MNKSLKIGIVCYPTFGGSGIVATELGKKLAERNHEVHFISYASPLRLNGYQSNIFYHEVEIPHYPLFEFHLYSLALASKIIEVAKYKKLDILHVHYAIPHSISGYLSRTILQKEGIDLKIVTTLHGTDITLTGIEPEFYPLVKFAIDESDAVTTVSHYLKERTIKSFRTERDIEVIYNFIDTEVYIRTDCSRLSGQIAPEHEIIMMHISTFRPVKRVTDTLYVLKHVLEKIPAKLVLIGDGPDRYECERLSRELGIEEHVRFLGKQVSIPELLSCTNFLLITSEEESFGLSALEAMSCSVPVISTNAGGLKEVVENGKSGVLVDVGDTKAMADAVISLSNNSEKLNSMADEGRKRAVEKFNADRIISQYESLYFKLKNLKNQYPQSVIGR